MLLTLGHHIVDLYDRIEQYEYIEHLPIAGNGEHNSIKTLPSMARQGKIATFLIVSCLRL